MSEEDGEMVDRTGAKIGGTTGAKVGGTTGAKVGGTTGANVGGLTGANVGGTTGANVGGTTGAKVGGITGAKVGGITGAKVGGITGAYFFLFLKPLLAFLQNTNSILSNKAKTNTSKVTPTISRQIMNGRVEYDRGTTLNMLTKNKRAFRDGVRRSKL